MTPTQLREAIEQLEREGYVLCKKEPVAFSEKDRLTAIRLRCDIQDRHMQYYTPLYAAAPAYSGGE